MPVYFGFFVALLVALFAVSNNTKKKKWIINGFRRIEYFKKIW
jgi:hypothetical protein